jgi:hypothetical protein
LTEDVAAQERLISNPHAIGCILKLCVKTTGQSQEKIFRVLDRLCRQGNSLNILLSNHIFEYLLSPELLSLPSTTLSVRHSTASLINRLTTLQPKEFPVRRFMNVLLLNGRRVVDGFIEMQLLSAFYSHVNYLAQKKISLNLNDSEMILLHLITEIRDEAFEDLEHVSGSPTSQSHLSSYSRY